MTLSPAIRPTSRAIADGATLAEMQSCLRRHIQAALIECHGLARDFQMLDPDDVMDALYKQFGQDGAVRDCFSDGFGKATALVAEAGGVL